MRKLIVILSASMILLIAGCSEQSATEKESAARDQNFAGLQNRQPAQAMDYSPTRETINFWMDTWEEEGKVSYVYLLASNGQEVGYYVMDGLPVSMCATLTPPYEIVNRADGDLEVPAQAMDGVWYSGNQCSQYYGKDAVTGSYIEYTIGNGINHLVTEQPLPKPDVEPLTTTSIEDVENQNGE